MPLVNCKIMPSTECRGGIPQSEQLGETQEANTEQERQIISPERQALPKDGHPRREEQLRQVVKDGYQDEDIVSNLFFRNPDGSIPLDFLIFGNIEKTKDQPPE